MNAQLMITIGKVFVFHGKQHDNYCEMLETTTPNSSFQPIASSLPFACRSIGKIPLVFTCIVKGDIFLLGTTITDCKYLHVVQKYTIATDTWTMMPNSKKGISTSNRDYNPCVVVGNKILLFDFNGALLESYDCNQ